jgi:hypothetical protein
VWPDSWIRLLWIWSQLKLQLSTSETVSDCWTWSLALTLVLANLFYLGKNLVILCYDSRVWLRCSINNRPTWAQAKQQIRVTKFITINAKNLVTLFYSLSLTLMLDKPDAESNLLKISSCSALAFGVTTFITIIIMILVKLCCAT